MTKTHRGAWKKEEEKQKPTVSCTFKIFASIFDKTPYWKADRSQLSNEGYYQYDSITIEEIIWICIVRIMDIRDYSHTFGYISF